MRSTVHGKTSSLGGQCTTRSEQRGGIIFVSGATARTPGILELLSRYGQGLGKASKFGPNALTPMTVVLTCVRKARKLSYSLTQEAHTAGLNAMGAPARPSHAA